MRVKIQTPWCSNQKQSTEVFYKKRFLKNFAIFTGKHLCWSFSLIIFFKMRLQHRCVPVNIAEFLRAPILKNICERLLLPLVVFCKDFVDISFEYAWFHILEDSIWLQLMCFLVTIGFWFVKYIFGLVGTTSMSAKDFDLCSIYRSNLTGRLLQNFEFSQWVDISGAQNYFSLLTF